MDSTVEVSVILGVGSGNTVTLDVDRGTKVIDVYKAAMERDGVSTADMRAYRFRAGSQNMSLEDTQTTDVVEGTNYFLQATDQKQG